MLSALFPWLLTLAVAPSTYVLRGQVAHVAPGTTIYLTHYQNAWLTLDSATVDAAGRVEMRGELAAPILGALKVKGQKFVCQFPLHPGDELTFQLAPEQKKRRFTVTGSVGVAQWQQFREDIAPHIMASTQLPASHAGLRRLRALVRTTPDNFLAAYLTKAHLSRQVSQQDFVDSMAVVLAGRQPGLAEVQALTTRTRTAVSNTGADKAQLAPDFTLPTVAGPAFSLSSLRGKYVLVDFWASWCGPCRAENPHLKALYQQYQSKGLEIVSLSVDIDAGKWRKAVVQDQLPWIQVSDLKGWDSPTAQLYGVQAVPSSFIIDPTGHLVARDLRGEVLEKRLRQLLP